MVIIRILCVYTLVKIKHNKHRVCYVPQFKIGTPSRKHDKGRNDKTYEPHANIIKFITIFMQKKYELYYL